MGESDTLRRILDAAAPLFVERGYQGVLGMEHGKSKGGKEGEVALMEAYRAADAW